MHRPGTWCATPGTLGAKCSIRVKGWRIHRESIQTRAMTTNGPQGAELNHGTQPAAHPEEKRLPLFLKISIVLLVALSLASISMLFVGKFEGGFIRIFSTFIIFTVFVLLTALDTHLNQRSTWYAPVALIGNSYILALTLVVTWMTDYQPFYLGWMIFWKAFYIIFVTRAVVASCQLLLGRDDKYPPATGIFALVTSILAVVSGILFTAPTAIAVFDIRIPELYWRFAVAALLLTALGLSVTLLLRWQYGAADREQARIAREAALRAQQARSAAMYPPVMPAAPIVPPSAGTAQPAQAGQPGQLLPWPLFPDGRPLPMLPDGQPDFSALNR